MRRPGRRQPKTTGGNDEIAETRRLLRPVRSVVGRDDEPRPGRRGRVVGAELERGARAHPCPEIHGGQSRHDHQGRGHGLERAARARAHGPALRCGPGHHRGPARLGERLCPERPDPAARRHDPGQAGLREGGHRLRELERQALGHPLPDRDPWGDLQQGPLQGGGPRSRQAAEDLGRADERRQGAHQERTLRLRHHRRRRGRQHDLPLTALHLDERRRHPHRRT